MDILTPKGLETVAHERRCAAIFEMHNPRDRYVKTKVNVPCSVDAVVARDGVVIAMVEQKSRIMTLSTLVGDFANEWLVTSDKLDRAREVAAQFGVPLYGFLYLVPDECLLIKRLTEIQSGAFVDGIRRMQTITQATVNGGCAERLNAFIKMDNAKLLFWHPLA